MVGFAQNFGFRTGEELSPGFERARQGFEQGRFVDFGTRSAAYVIDFFAFLPVPLALAYALYGVGGILARGGELRLSDFIGEIILMALSVLCWARWGATPGKRLLRMRIVNAADGRPAGARALAVRYVVRIVPLITASVMIAALHVGRLDGLGGASLDLHRLILGLVGQLALLVGVGGIGFLWAAFDARGQALHDKIAGTAVVEEARDADSRKA